MQTKTTIQQLLESSGVRPNKRLGQHFLIDLNLIRLFLEEADIQPEDLILEIGPGSGSLTEELAARAKYVIAVEYDKILAQITAARLNELKIENVELINLDALQNQNAFAPVVVEALNRAAEKTKGRLMLVANLPYDIAAAVVMNLITGPVTAEQMYVTVQLEVAQRMTAPPGSKDYGTISIMMEATGCAKIFHKLGTNVFWPKPAVSSAMVKYIRSEDKINNIKDISLLSELIALLMGHRRKMIKASTKMAQDRLKNIKNWLQIFQETNINPAARPEKLSSNDFVKLANACAERIRGGF
jgi:16S rRNA (adenine1518-N6/adenine1519-N6)-dimethyltransferase